MNDPLSEVIALLQPRTVFAKGISGAGRWAVRYSAFDAPSFCAVLEGSCRLAVDGHRPLTLEAGDFLLLPATPGFTMRRILIDYAVARRAQKRGGGVDAEALDDAVAMAISRSDELLALDEALDRLAGVNERYGRVVECRFFGGMSVEETAEALGTSPATVKRDWVMARAWLNRELAGG